MTDSSNNLLLCIGFTLLIILSARISIPMDPVPLTMQTLAIYVTAMLLPMWCAVFSVTLYVFLGAIGLPVFAAGRSGMEVVLGPTGGFVFGFIIVTCLLSWLTEAVRSKRNDYSVVELAKKIILPCAVASITLQVLGIVWGKVYTANSWPEMYSNWLQPFYLNMISKIILATVITAFLWKKFPKIAP